MTAYYNEIDPYAAQWLRNLIAAGHIAPGDVDERSIVDVRADDLRGYTQCHFFAGIGGWSLALRLAGWSDDRPVWTGSCPCQPFSAAGKGEAFNDERHLWPAWFPLFAELRPPTVFGEQVEAAIGWGWLDAVFADLEGEGYACGATILPACGVGAPHIRQRLWLVADSEGERWTRRPHQQDGRRGQLPPGHRGQDGSLAHTDASGRIELGRGGLLDGERSSQRHHLDGCGTICGVGDSDEPRQPLGIRQPRNDGAPRSTTEWKTAQQASHWHCDWLPCTDGKARPVEPGTFPLAHGVPARVGKLRAFGNAIVPQVAGEFIAAFLETEAMIEHT